MTSGAKKNENRFLESQQSGIKDRKTKINKIISNLNQSNVYIKNPTQLAKLIAKSINDEIDAVEDSAEVNIELKRNEGKIVYGTLLRSKFYAPLIHAFFNRNKNMVSNNSSSADLLSLQLENSELKATISALNNYIANQEAKPLIDKTVKASQKKNINLNNVDSLFKLDACYKIIMNLIEHSEYVFLFYDNQIINSSKSINNVVASKDLLIKSGLYESQLFGEDDDE
jgi:hypothetical protein